jgi:hypothetical protein
MVMDLRCNCLRIKMTLFSNYYLIHSVYNCDVYEVKMMCEVGCRVGQHGGHFATYMHSWWNWNGPTVMELKCHCWRCKMT